MHTTSDSTDGLNTSAQTLQANSTRHSYKSSKPGCPARTVCSTYWELLLCLGGTARKTVVCLCHGNAGCGFQAWRNLIAQLLHELLFCLELKAMLRRISTFISSTAWLKKWNGKSCGSLNTSWEALALSKTSS